MSDNLPVVWSAEPHTLAKHKILDAYLQAWMAILSRQSRRVANPSTELRFIDGFAGPGVYERGQPGSPVLALRTALNHAVEFPIPVRFTFIEKDPERCSILRRELSAYDAQIAGSPNVRLDSPICGDCAEVLTGIVDDSLRAGRRFGPALVFLDQFGYSEVPMSLIAKIMGQPVCEVFTYLAWRELNRFITDETKWAGLDEAFGGQEWRPALALSGAKREHFLIETYKGALKDKGGADYTWSFAMQDASENLLFWLVFCTNSLRGLEEMKEAMEKVDPGGGFKFTDRDAEGQLRLLGGFDQDWLAHELARSLAGRTMTVLEVKEYVLTRTACRLFRGALAKLESAHELTAISPPSKRRAGTFPDESMKVRFADRALF